MSFIDDIKNNQFAYEPYNGYCPDFSKFFDKLKFPQNYYDLNPRPTPSLKGSSWYFPDCEYIVVWYDSNLNFPRKDSQAYVKIKLVNLTKPTYEKELVNLENPADKKENVTHLSILYITVPINILHYFFIGSVWKKGKAIKQVKLKEYLVTASQAFNGNRDNVSYQSFYDQENHKYNNPFQPNLYTIKSDYNNYKYDKNQLIKIHQDGIDFIVHPLHLFCSHYGMSSDIKRILTSFNWDEVKNRLYLDRNEPSLLHSKEHVVLPKNFVKKDAIFLYHLKYDKLVAQKRTKLLNNEIKISKENPRLIKVPFWHDQEVQLKIRGIELGDVVLCAEIIGINQPNGDDITLVLHRDKKANKGNTQSNEKPITKTYKREVNTEYLGTKITDSEPNNRTSQSIRKRFEELGRQRIINTLNIQHENEHSYQSKGVQPKEVNELGFGDHYGMEGQVGLAVCFLDSESENKDIKLFRLWDMAQNFALINGGQAHWFTPQLGFRNDDNLVFLSLDQDTAFAYPEIALVIRIILSDEIFYLVDFSQKSHDISMSGIAYKESGDEDFITLNDIQNSKLAEILSEVVRSEQLPTDYISQQNEKETKIATFRHPTAESSNWVFNAISKLTRQILSKL